MITKELTEKRKQFIIPFIEQTIQTFFCCQHIFLML